MRRRERRERRRRRYEEEGRRGRRRRKKKENRGEEKTHLPLLPLRFILGMASLLSTSWSKEEVGPTRVCCWVAGVPPLLSLSASSNMCGR